MKDTQTHTSKELVVSGYTETEANQVVGTILNSKAVMQGISELIGIVDTNKTIYISELQARYRDLINSKLFENFDTIIKDFNELKLDKYKVVDELKNKYFNQITEKNTISYIENTLISILDKHNTIYEKKIENDIHQIILDSENKQDSDTKVIKYIKNLTQRYIEENFQNQGQDLEIMNARYKFFSYSTQRLINDINIGKFTLKDLIKFYRKNKTSTPKCKKRTKRATHRVFIRPPLSLDIRPPITELIRPLCA